eukprot:CAMPEP_0194300176 /NCGR_PEP_ID=MMETSP0169-20130528/61113_1 /TAXON_ID=218684 /ORGANISM="Corethron pennatum, Strain L29A3" /LENGTH=608 /DNA_ID=CAMNT_0039050323 /DNA_START=416 /DNA_END=2239 /DNA_ORIENTATION=+
MIASSDDCSFSPSGVAVLFLQNKSPTGEFVKKSVADPNFKPCPELCSTSTNNSEPLLKVPLKSILRCASNSSENSISSVQAINLLGFSPRKANDNSTVPGDASSSCSSSSSDFSTDFSFSCNDRGSNTDMPFPDDESQDVKSIGRTGISPPASISPNANLAFSKVQKQTMTSKPRLRSSCPYYMGTPILPVVGGLRAMENGRRTLFSHKANTSLRTELARDSNKMDSHATTEKGCFFLMFKSLSPPSQQFSITSSSCPDFREKERNRLTEKYRKIPSIPPFRRHNSDNGVLERRGRVVSFDSRVSVVEFERYTVDWYDDVPEDVDNNDGYSGCLWNKFFPVLSQSSANLLATDQATLNVENEIPSKKWFSRKQAPPKIIQPVEGKVGNPSSISLRDANTKLDVDSSDIVKTIGITNSYKRSNLFNEIQTILIVDCHEIFLSLFSKGLKIMMPHVQITTTTSITDAQSIIRNGRNLPISDNRPAVHGFDIIIIEQNLSLHPHSIRDIKSLYTNKESHQKEVTHLLTGTDLLQNLILEEKKLQLKLKPSDPSLLSTLMIGVSMSFRADEAKMINSGADLFWKKPPPPMNSLLTSQIVHAIVKKRGHIKRS